MNRRQKKVRKDASGRLKKLEQSEVRKRKERRGMGGIKKR
ncbi:hypothetical protein E2C01_037308 [Portunus trituberculatus]|uniref:Uncharacterized protein n=1 Tax=Portunus trituberculatus TaxID=210409 RepID=A0A5B7FEB2_PORTR|nr:hypothetical protein [Portunus trituberculatus]